MTDADRTLLAHARAVGPVPRALAVALAELAEREAARADAAEAVVVALRDAIGRTAREAAEGPVTP